jgi:hypothetical protein
MAAGQLLDLLALPVRGVEAGRPRRLAPDEGVSAASEVRGEASASSAPKRRIDAGHAVAPGSSDL